MFVLVTGATGFIGHHLVKTLLAQNHRVRALGRNPTMCSALTLSGAEVVQADLRQAEAVVAACAGVEAVCHLGALSSPWARKIDFHTTNVGGTAHVLIGCRQHHVKRLVFVSTPSVVFAGRSFENQTEDAPYPRRQLSVYSLTKKLAEDLVNDAQHAGLATVILRPKLVFGPHDNLLFPRLVRAAEHRRLSQIGPGTNLVDLTYVDNVVQALLRALLMKAAVGKTYTITNGEHVQIWNVIKVVLHRLGYNANLRALPYPIAYSRAALMELRATLFGGEPTLTRYTTALLGRTQTYDISAARRDLEYRPRVSVAEGIERTLATIPRRSQGSPASRPPG
jgi:nucleoside-diphosphate-sugar epimerase